MPVSRYATQQRTWGAVAVGVMLVGLGAVVEAPSASAALAPQVTFNTPGSYFFEVPGGITSLQVTVSGGQGGTGNPGKSGGGGLGATVTGTFAVTDQDVLILDVAGAGGSGTGGLGGGGAGGALVGIIGANSGGGGGASRIRDASNNLTLVAAGGGGGDASFFVAGGGSGQTGGRASGTYSGVGGAPGTVTAGGAGGAGGVPGDLAPGCSTGITGGSGTAGASIFGGTGGAVQAGMSAGGGGGGGYFGGGGGGGGGSCPAQRVAGSGGGGGGGSSYTDTSVTGVSVTQAVWSGNGQITIAYASPTSTTGQPPTIIGAAPDGTLRTPYSYAYQVTGDPTVTLYGGTLPPGLTLSPTGAISGTPTTSGTYTFTLAAANRVATALLTDTIVIRSAAEARQADLSLAMTGPPAASAGAELAYQVSVVNHGPGSAESVTTMVVVPPGLEVVAASGASRQTGRVVRWTEALLPAGGSVTYTLTVRPTRSRDVVLRAHTSSQRTSDPNQDDNRVSLGVTLT